MAKTRTVKARPRLNLGAEQFILECLVRNALFDPDSDNRGHSVGRIKDAYPGVKKIYVNPDHIYAELKSRKKILLGNAPRFYAGKPAVSYSPIVL